MSMSPEDLLTELQKGCSTKISETLEAIYRVCMEQRKRGVDDYSISTISKLGTQRGVPKAQSIRNKSGEKYRALIASFAENSPVKDLGKQKHQELDWIDEINNPKHRLLAKIQASELIATRKKLQEIIPPNLQIDIYDYKSTGLGSEHKLSNQERRALEYLLSNSFQSKWKLTPTDYGELIDENKHAVFKAATLDAIKKALDFL